jgi:hypothetical protein
MSRNLEAFFVGLLPCHTPTMMANKWNAIVDLSDSESSAEQYPVKKKIVKKIVVKKIVKKKNFVEEKKRKTYEFFSGSGNLSRALRRCGFETREIDLKHSVEHDLASSECSAKLTEEVVSDEADYASFAPPCNTYSNARFPKIRPTSWNYCCIWGKPGIAETSYQSMLFA